MPLFVVLALQAAAAPPAIAEIDFDLARYSEIARGGSACRRDDPNVIVVCARHGNGDYPIEEMARIFEPRRIVAQTRLTGPLIGDAHVESVPLDRGAVSNRALVRVTLPF